MQVNVVIPSVGESVTEAVIGQWLVKSGDYVKKNQVLLALETDKASVEVVSEHDGQIELRHQEGETIAIGAVVAVIETSVAPPSVGEAVVGAGIATPVSSLPPSAPPASVIGGSAQGLSGVLSPAVQKIVTEKGLNPEQIIGTGKDGRITKGDALQALESAKSVSLSKVSESLKNQESLKVSDSLKSSSSLKEGSSRQTRQSMTHIRKKIAERLLMSQQTTATLTTFNEIDMSRVMDLRSKYKDKFKEKYQVNLGFMGFFVKASVEALKEWPMVNAFLEGQEIVYNHYVHTGVAVGTDKGLIVPVIKDADTLSIAQIEIAIRDYAIKAREGKITISDLSGGTFTISNGGVYGSLLSTPILNPPQTGILGLHKIEERPIALNGQVVIRPMMYVALSYDHRMIDGKEAVSFLVKIKEGLENPERLLLGV
jgi:2-oxoglutarate dehydrogenase E2 component (dihydrolipoamide succinyltransferase)